MKISHNLLPTQKSRKHSLTAEIDLYPYATELYEELDKLGVINRIKEIPQLGVIKVRKKLSKTRFDYVMLQLYLHKLVKHNLQGDLRYTYNNYLKSNEFGCDYSYPCTNSKPSIGDVLQILTIVYNIGHFYNTFTASRAITMIVEEDDTFYEKIKNACEDERYKNAAENILKSKNYQRLHLLNSILILEQCDKSKQSISVALALLYSYINENLLPEESKLKYAFTIFRNVRTISYMAYDLQIADTPLTIDLCDEKAMLLLLKELLSEYNNNQSSNHLVNSVTKLLDDTVYNENSNAICYYEISRKIVSTLKKGIVWPQADYYNDLFINKSSPLNRNYSHKRDYVQSQILKLTFSVEQRNISCKLLTALEKVNNTRVGYYDRHSGDQTILVSIKRNCSPTTKRYAAYKVLKFTIQHLRRIINISPNDIRFLLATKFFLYYLFDENPVVIKPTLSRKKCVICTRGKNARIRELNSLLENSIGNGDENHEVKFLLDRIVFDTKNDTTITVPASILVYQKDAAGRKLCEFDGIIIYPMRSEKQVIFLEAKNRKVKPSTARNCLSEKFDNFTIKYNKDDINIVNCDAYFSFTI